MGSIYPAPGLVGCLEPRGRAPGAGPETSIAQAEPEAALPHALQFLLHPPFSCPSSVSTVSAPGLCFSWSVLSWTLRFSHPHLSSESGQMLKVRRNPPAHPTPSIPSLSRLAHAPSVFPPFPFDSPTFQSPNWLKSLPSLKTDGQVNTSLPTQSLFLLLSSSRAVMCHVLYEQKPLKVLECRISTREYKSQCVSSCKLTAFRTLLASLHLPCLTLVFTPAF